MKGNLIKRSDAIEAMEQRYQDILRIFKRKVKDGEKAVVLDMIGCVKSLPSADRPQGEWIPCSERLPEAGVSVIITSKGGYVYTSNIAHGEWEYGGDVVAWMSLPEPWKGADNDN